MHGSSGVSGELGNYCDTSLCCTTIHYWFTKVGAFTHTCCLVHSTRPCRVPSVRLESQEWHWRMNNWWQCSMSVWHRVFAWLQQIWQVHMYESYHLYWWPTSTLERQKEVAYLHRGLASYISTWWSCTLQSYILLSIPPVIICEFSLRMLMNYMKNVAELLVHARTVDTRRSSLIFVECLGTRLYSNL